MVEVKTERIDHRGVAERYSTPRRLTVASKTIGTQFVYGFATCNISLSGLLLRSDKIGVPFRENTILEMIIDPEGDWFSQPVSILGRVVRRVDHANGHHDLGINVIHMDGSESSEWLNCINNIQAQNKDLMGQAEDIDHVKKQKHRQIA